MLDLKAKEMRESWAQDGSITYQLIGDNWDKNILPSYRTCSQLFFIVGKISKRDVLSQFQTFTF